MHIVRILPLVSLAFNDRPAKPRSRSIIMIITFYRNSYCYCIRLAVSCSFLTASVVWPPVAATAPSSSAACVVGVALSDRDMSCNV